MPTKNAVATDSRPARAPSRVRRNLFRGLLLLLLLVAGFLVVYLRAVKHLPQATPPEWTVASLPPEVLLRYRSDPALGLEPTLEPEITDDGLRVLSGRLRVRRLDVPKPHDARFHFYFAEGRQGRTATILVTPILVTGPLALARYVDPGSVLMFLTRQDTSVPSALQERLRGALGCPEAFSLPTGHYSAVLYLPFFESRARAFLAARLDLGAGT